jgi:uncharacterized protein (TIGR02147 family)
VNQAALFEHTEDYRAYLLEALEQRAAGKRGERNRLSNFLGCQPAFVSQVLHSRAHFNLEHGAAINRYLHHNRDESHYFLLLLQKTRAATNELRSYFDAQLLEILRQRLILKQRFRVEDALSLEDKSTYYSSWIFGAVRVLLTVPGFRTREKIAERLRIPVSKANSALEFLSSRGLVAEEGGEFVATQLAMHLGNDSSMVAKHHNNWRNRAVASLDLEGERDLHYSSVVSLSLEDALKIKKMMIDHLERVRSVVRDSPAEDIFSIGIDFFAL